MAQKKEEAREGKLLSTFSPPDSPLAPDGLQSHTPDANGKRALDDFPPEMRRAFSSHITAAHTFDSDHKTMEDAVFDTSLTAGLQLMFLTGSVFIGARGFRYADFRMSPIRRYTENEFISRCVNLHTLIGGVVAGVTLYQLPSDISLVREARSMRQQAAEGREREVKAAQLVYESAMREMQKNASERVSGLLAQQKGT